MFINACDLGFEYSLQRCHSQHIIELLPDPAPLGTNGKAEPDGTAALLSAAVTCSGEMSQLSAVVA